MTGAEANVRYREALQKSFSGSSAPERRLLREAESERLLKTARNRAVGLAADGTFLGIGIVMLALNSTALGVPLVVNGAFILVLVVHALICLETIGVESTFGGIKSNKTDDVVAALDALQAESDAAEQEHRFGPSSRFFAGTHFFSDRAALHCAQPWTRFLMLAQ